MLPSRLLHWKYLLSCAALFAGASLADTRALPQIEAGAGQTAYATQLSASAEGDISVLTYNVAGLPWPLKSNRPAALRVIGERLAAMRAAGAAPSVIVLQEAFIEEAWDIGAAAGYPYVVAGPYMRTGALVDGPVSRNWMIGETAGAAMDSGLIVLSDLPVVDIARSSFPEGACAGYDCLAAKGVVLVTLELPVGRLVQVANTHFNSRGASKAPVAEAAAAYRRQAEFLSRFLTENRREGVPLVIAGDFNRGQRPDRIAALQDALGRVAGQPVLDALRHVMVERPEGLSGNTDADTAVARARDLQYALDGSGPGSGARLEPVAANVPFGTEADGSMLSDHIGYAVSYRYSAGWDFGPRAAR